MVKKCDASAAISPLVDISRIGFFFNSFVYVFEMEYSHVYYSPIKFAYFPNLLPAVSNLL